MKIKIYLALIIILMFSYENVKTVHAAENEEDLFLTESDSEYQEILGLEHEIYNCIFASYYINPPREMRENDIDFSKAYKVYVKTDLFEHPNKSQMELNTLVSNAEYVWVLPISIGSPMRLATISKAQPLRDGIEDSLSQEEIEKHEKEVGHWAIESINICSKKDDFLVIVENAIAAKGLPATGYTLQFFGETKRMPSVFGLVSYPNEDRYIIPVMEPRDVMIDIHTEGLSFNNSSESSIQKGEVYPFSTVTKRISIKIKVLLTLLGGLGAAIFLYMYRKLKKYFVDE